MNSIDPKSTYLNDATDAEEQQVGDNDTKTLPIEHPPSEEVKKHEVHHERAKDDITICHVSIL